VELFDLVDDEWLCCTMSFVCSPGDTRI
jgi:hypothetical protein